MNQSTIDDSQTTIYGTGKHMVEYFGIIKGYVITLNGASGAVINDDKIEWTLGNDPTWYYRNESKVNYSNSNILGVK